MPNQYLPRFISPEQMVEAVNLYHLARTALCGADSSKHARRVWASRELAKKYEGSRTWSETGAYKDLTCALESW